MSVHIKSEFERSRKTYGSPRIKLELASQGIAAGKHRVARLMKESGIRASVPKRFKATTMSKHNHSRSPNIVERRFNELGCTPNRLWVTDITYIRAYQGWMYLCVFLDVFSRKVVGYSIEDSMEASMVNDALKMGLRRRSVIDGMIVHSDQGIQYASDEFRKVLEAFHIVQSMSRKGDCWDNSAAESFFATLKRELIDRQSWVSKSQVKQAVIEWIDCFYNRQRRHSSAGNMSPVDYENLTNQTVAA